MTKLGTHISDVILLENLNEQIRSSGEAMSNIDQNVSNYLNGVRESLENQLNILKEKLDEAQQRLSASENALSCCKASQVCDPMTGMLVPDCTCEENAVESDRMDVEKYKDKYEKGERIIEECVREIGEYSGSGGGHSLIHTMCSQQTPKASQLLRDCIDKLQDILNSNMVVSSSNMDVVTGPA